MAASIGAWSPCLAPLRCTAYLPKIQTGLNGDSISPVRIARVAPDVAKPSVGQPSEDLRELPAFGAEDVVQRRIEVFGHGPTVAVEHDAERLFVVEGGLVGPLVEALGDPARAADAENV